MRFSVAMLGIAGSAVLGLAAGIVAVEGNLQASPVHLLATWIRNGHPPGQPAALASELTTLRKRSNELDVVQAELQSITDRVEHMEGAAEFGEARRLGIIDAVARSRPTLHPSAIRRMGIALVTEARRNNIDPLLLAAIARIESGFNPFATSGAGALGLLQLTPVTGRTLSHMQGEKLGADAELYDIETNVALGARYIRELMKEFRSVDVALLAYNRGIGGARLALKEPDGHRYLQGYPKAVLRERRRLAEAAAERRDTHGLSM